MGLRLPSSVFAFLSACETAKGSSQQGVHLSTAMLFCGFRSVIGTLWGMDDADGPTIAGAFYRELCVGGRDTIEMDDILYALDAAVTKLKEHGACVERWAPFVHYGA
jgi:CHAT domain-containing protein